MAAQELLKEIPEETCCCCGHKLGQHIPETEGFRCHCLGSDGYQCECFLRYGRYAEGLAGYDLKKRIQKFIEELRGDK
jgi:hypothetical protein